MQTTGLSNTGLANMKGTLKDRFSAVLQRFGINGDLPYTAFVIHKHEVTSVVGDRMEKEKWWSIVHDIALNKKADALILITDAWRLDENGSRRIGELLMAQLILPDGSVAAGLGQWYKRLHGKVVWEDTPDYSAAGLRQNCIASW